MLKRVKAVTVAAAALLITVSASVSAPHVAGGARVGGAAHTRSGGGSVGHAAAHFSAVAAPRNFSGGSRVVHSAVTVRPQTFRSQTVRHVEGRSGGARFEGSRNGHHFSHARHFWHGRWWSYGIGSCWVYDDDYDEYDWVCD